MVRGWRLLATAVTVCTALQAGGACASDMTYDGARSVRILSPTTMQASVLDGAIRRTVTLSAGSMKVVEDVPTGRPSYLVALDVTSSLLPYVVARAVEAHVPPGTPTTARGRTAATEP